MPKELSYSSENIVVRYDVRRCIHAAECVNGLPSVFDPERKPWIDAAAADSDEIATVIHSCPSGALSYERLDGGENELGAAENVVRLRADGPLFLAGDIEIRSSDGTLLSRETRVALCRCGQSANKPFCDNAHEKSGFSDSGRLGKGGVKMVEGQDTTCLVVTLAKDGPLLLAGDLRIEAVGDENRSGSKAALCRCGQSENRPFCDGSHRDADFVS